VREIDVAGTPSPGSSTCLAIPSRHLACRRSTSVTFDKASKKPEEALAQGFTGSSEARGRYRQLNRRGGFGRSVPSLRPSTEARGPSKSVSRHAELEPIQARPRGCYEPLRHDLLERSGRAPVVRRAKAPHLSLEEQGVSGIELDLAGSTTRQSIFKFRRCLTQARTGLDA